MRALIVMVWLGVGPLALAAGGATKTTVAQVRKTAAPPGRVRAIAAVPRDDGRPVREDRGRIETRIVAARSQLQQGQYSEAVMTLTRAFAETQPSLEQQIAIYELLGACYVALGQIELAVGSFTEVLRRRPDFTLDPIKSSPKIRAALETAKSHF